jgi:WD40 repeat protein
VTVKKIQGSSSGSTSILSTQFHPDGVLLATGNAANVVQLWDIRAQASAASFVEHTGPINAISVSENGYLLASGSADGTVKIWDLRKQICSKTLECKSEPFCSTHACVNIILALDGYKNLTWILALFVFVFP